MTSTMSNKAPDKSLAFEVDGGAHEVRFFEGKHQYFATGGRWKGWTWVPSTTAISKLTDPAGDKLIGWAVRQTTEYLREQLLDGRGELTAARVRTAIEEAGKAHTRKKEAAGDHGAAVHALFERASQTKLWKSKTADPDMRGYLEATQEWASAWKVKPLEAEFLVLNPVLGYAGMGDLVALATDPDADEGQQLWYFDLKTGKGVYRSHYAQCSGYQMAREAMGFKVWTRAAILHLPKGAASIDVRRQTGHDADKEAFTCARYLHWWAKEQVEGGVPQPAAKKIRRAA